MMKIRNDVLSRGFTLVELLVALLIIAILAAILLPAIQRTRESGRRTQCANNIKQIGLALQIYHQAMRTLPPASIWQDRGEPLGDNIASVGVVDRVAYGIAPHSESAKLHSNWMLMILPYLEQANLAEIHNDDVAISDLANRSVRETVVPGFVCASDPSSGGENWYERLSVIGRSGNRYARGNYAMNVGPNRRCILGQDDITTGSTCEDGYSVQGASPETSSLVIGSGIGGVNVGLSLAAFQEVGLSNLVAIDELRAGEYPADPRGVWALGFVSASMTAGHGLYSQGGSPNSDHVQSDQFVGCQNLRALVGDGRLAWSGMPCFPPIIPSGMEVNVQATARSHHRGGVQVGKLDGSIGFLSDSVDPQLWHDLHSRTVRPIRQSAF